MQVQFKPGQVPEETILELKLGEKDCKKVYDLLVSWVNRTYNEIAALGPVCCPSLGEYWEHYAWADLREGAVQVNLDEGTVELFFFNEPEGEDRLDGAHPHWTEPNEHLWIQAVPRVRNLLQGVAN